MGSGPIECTPAVQQLAGFMQVCSNLGMQLQDSSRLLPELCCCSAPVQLMQTKPPTALHVPAPVQHMLTSSLAATSAGGLPPDIGIHLLGVQPDSAPSLMQIKLPPDAKDLIQRLLCDVEHRLGSHGIRELKVCTRIKLGWC